jgi:uncharacterized membrane protein YphA (DoxX/SURF4 family)
MSKFATSDSNELAEEFGQRWNRFWFAPADPLPCSVLRIIVGALAACHFAVMGPSLSIWFASDGALSPAAVAEILDQSGGGASFHLSYLNYIPASTALYVIHALAIIFALAFAAGLFTRISGVLTLVAMLSYVHRAPQIAGHIEPVLSYLLAYLSLAPSGAYFSLDQRLFGSGKKSPLGTFLAGSTQPSLTANLSLRLIQVHVAMFYAMMGLTKLYGDAWWQGSAVWVLLAQTESRTLDASGLRRAGEMGEYALNFLAHTIVYFELAFPVLIWTRLARPVLLALSIVVWLTLIVTTGHLLFGLLMLATGLAFVPAQKLRSMLGATADEYRPAPYEPAPAL